MPECLLSSHCSTASTGSSPDVRLWTISPPGWWSDGSPPRAGRLRAGASTSRIPARSTASVQMGRGPRHRRRARRPLRPGVGEPSRARPDRGDTPVHRAARACGRAPQFVPARRRHPPPGRSTGHRAGPIAGRRRTVGHDRPDSPGHRRRRLPATAGPPRRGPAGPGPDAAGPPPGAHRGDDRLRRFGRRVAGRGRLPRDLPARALPFALPPAPETGYAGPAALPGRLLPSVRGPRRDRRRSAHGGTAVVGRHAPAERAVDPRGQVAALPRLGDQRPPRRRGDPGPRRPHRRRPAATSPR
jgi:hypothetical protein